MGPTETERRVIRRLAAVFCAALLAASITSADQSAILLRQGFFKEITDAAARSFEIQTFRMSADGSRVAYFGWNGTNTELRVIKHFSC